MDIISCLILQNNNVFEVQVKGKEAGYSPASLL